MVGVIGVGFGGLFWIGWGLGLEARLVVRGKGFYCLVLVVFGLGAVIWWSGYGKKIDVGFGRLVYVGIILNVVFFGVCI